MLKARELLQSLLTDRKLKAARLGLAAVITLLCIILGGEDGGWLVTAGFTVAYLIAGADVLVSAVVNTLRLNVPEDTLLVSVASVCAMAMREHMAAALMMLLYCIGRAAADALRERAAAGCTVTADIPETAKLWKYGELKSVSVKNLVPGDTVVVAQGAAVPVDARLEGGSAMFRLPDFAGSGVPARFAEGDELPAGSINTGREVRMTVLRTSGDSSAARVNKLIESAPQHRSDPEYSAAGFVRVFGALLVLVALVVAVLPVAVFHNNSIEWVQRALVVLIAACPGAVTVSVPFAYYIGLRRAAKKGVLFSGNAALHNFGCAETFVFDKTGTLTTAAYNVTDIAPELISREDLLLVAIHAAHGADTPEARALRACYNGRVWEDFIGSREIIDDMGLRVFLDGREVCLGNAALMKRLGVEVEESADAAVDIFVTICGSYAGRISLGDPVRTGAAAAVKRLREAGVRRMMIMTGEREASVRGMAAELGIDEVCADCVLHERLERMTELIKNSPKNSQVAFVGAMDANPMLLARADVGVTLGGIPEHEEEAPRVYVVDADLARLAEAKRIAAQCSAAASRNIAIAMIVKLILVAAAVVGLCPLWAAAAVEALLQIACTVAVTGKK